MTARHVSSFVLATLLGLAGASALAQGARTNPTAATPATPPAPAPTTTTPQVDPESGALVETAPATNGRDAKIEHLVVEDSQVKIEETRVRGVTKKIVVHSKIPGMGSYEIQPKDPGLSPENDHAAGMRTFTFGF
jgi:hypothetical protein